MSKKSIKTELVEYKDSDIWNNKKYMGHLLKNKERVLDELSAFGIKKVVVFDEMTQDWMNWRPKEMTLAIYPLNNMMDQRGNRTKEAIRSLGRPASNTYGCIDVNTDEISQNHNMASYFPTRNLVVAHANPFVDGWIYGQFKASFPFYEYKERSDEDIWLYTLHEQWGVQLDNKINAKKTALEQTKRNIEDRKKQIFQDSSEIVLMKKELEMITRMKTNFKEEIEGQIQKIKKLPFVKKIEVKDRLYINIGDVYITSQIKVGNKKVDGIEVPDLKLAKVYIGELTLVIGSGEISVKNDNMYQNYVHPHAKTDRMCTGEADGNIHEALGSLRLYDLVKLLYSWAFSYNEQDTMCKVQRFYDLNPKKSKILQ